MTKKYAEWYEDFAGGPESMRCRISFDDVITYQQRVHPDYVDRDASRHDMFLDFVDARCAEIINE